MINSISYIEAKFMPNFPIKAFIVNLIEKQYFIKQKRTSNTIVFDLNISK
jgi:hypothetical protein